MNPLVRVLSLTLILTALAKLVTAAIVVLAVAGALFKPRETFSLMGMSLLGYLVHRQPALCALLLTATAFLAILSGRRATTTSCLKPLERSTAQSVTGKGNPDGIGSS